MLEELIKKHSEQQYIGKRLYRILFIKDPGKLLAAFYARMDSYGRAASWRRIGAKSGCKMCYAYITAGIKTQHKNFGFI